MLNTVDPNKAAGTAFSLYFGNNLATEKTTATFLKGVTGSEALGAKLAPTIMRLSKSAGARFGLGVAMVGTGVYAVYKYLAGAEKVDTPASKSLDALTEDKTFRYQLLGIVHENGRFQNSPACSKAVAGKRSPDEGVATAGSLSPLALSRISWRLCSAYGGAA